MIDVALLLTDPSVGAALMIGALALGMVAGAVAVALTLAYGG